ncbi:MAG: DUF4184 family protein [Steroidobacteraceae bacterium]
MPFTLSHIAAVLPGYRPLTRARVFSAAVIGSMVPDFGMLLPGSLARWQTHGMLALITFCLPIGLLAFWLTQLLIRPSVVEVLPDAAYLKLRAAPPPLSPRQIEAWVYAATAVLVGAVTHLIWDGFTHENARGVRMFPVLTDYGPDVAGHPLQLYRWLQHGSSVAGLAVVLAALLIWLRHVPPVPDGLPRRIPRRERLMWICAYILPPVAAAIASVVHAMVLEQPLFTTASALTSIAVWSMRGAAASLLLVSAVIQLRLGA